MDREITLSCKTCTILNLIQGAEINQKPCVNRLYALCANRWTSHHSQTAMITFSAWIAMMRCEMRRRVRKTKLEEGNNEDVEEKNGSDGNVNGDEHFVHRDLSGKQVRESALWLCR